MKRSNFSRISHLAPLIFASALSTGCTEKPSTDEAKKVIQGVSNTCMEIIASGGKTENPSRYNTQYTHGDTLCLCHKNETPLESTLGCGFVDTTTSKNVNFALRRDVDDKYVMVNFDGKIFVFHHKKSDGNCYRWVLHPHNIEKRVDLQLLSTGRDAFESDCFDLVRFASERAHNTLWHMENEHPPVSKRTTPPRSL